MSNKIKSFKISMERLTKVWLSKIDMSEEELVAEDMRWFMETFDKFFKEPNLTEFININGRYIKNNVFDEFDFSDFSESFRVESSESSERLKYVSVR